MKSCRRRRAAWLIERRLAARPAVPLGRILKAQHTQMAQQGSQEQGSASKRTMLAAGRTWILKLHVPSAVQSMEQGLPSTSSKMFCTAAARVPRTQQIKSTSRGIDVKGTKFPHALQHTSACS